MDSDAFDLGGLDEGLETAFVAEDRGPSDVEIWAEEQLSNKTTPAVGGKQAGQGWAVFDIETGPLPEDDLVRLYKQKSYEEFASDCDQRWKEETKRKKYDEYVVNAWGDFVKRAALSAMTGRVLAIGTATSIDLGVTIFGQSDEANLLSKFWQYIESWIADKSFIVGHNSNFFDLPFLIRRSWKLGVAVPREVMQGRYFNPLFKDTMEVWNCGEPKYVKLGLLAQFFGVGCKPEEEDCSGASFARLWNGTEAEKLRAISYLENDIEMTVGVARALKIIV